MLGKTLSQYRQLSECSIVGTRLFKDDILRQDYNNRLNCYVKTMKREDGIFIKVKGKYLIFYHQGLIDKIGKSYQKMVDYLTLNNLKTEEYFYEELIVGDWATKESKEMVYKISVRIFE